MTRDELMNAIDSPTVEALENVFNGPWVKDKSCSERIVEILAPRLNCAAQALEVTPAMLDAGAQALANDVWHPPQPLASLSNSDVMKYRRQALLVLKASLSLPSAQCTCGGDPSQLISDHDISCPVAISADRDWVEDAPHENGNYQCKCCECGQMFIGHKRRVLCKLCSNLLTPSVPSTDGKSL